MPGSDDPPIRVVVADDHAGYRRAISTMIGADPALEVCGDASDGVEALAAIEELSPDVALVDVRMPGLTGVELCRRLREEESRTRVVLITGVPDDALREQATAAGAAALLCKAASPAEVCDQLVEAARAPA
jgi:two-component system nitrate/nitrite response regulator NarL